MLALRMFWVLGIVALVCPWHARAQTGINQFNQAALTITGIPYVISTPGSYVLTGNLIVPPGLDAIQVTVDNVEIDLNGFTITGSGGTGISGSRLTVRRGVIEGFGIGLTIGLESKLIDLRITGNGQGVTGAVDSLISNTHITGCTNAYAIEMINGRIENSVIANNVGAGINSSSGSLIIGNHIADNDGGGIVDNSGAKIQDNVISNNGPFGISDLIGPPPPVPPQAPPPPVVQRRSSIIGNIIDRTTAGPGISTMQPALIKDNTVTRSFGSGIVCGPVCVVSGNTVDRNNLGAIAGAGGVTVADGSNVSGNAISYNEGFGLTLPAAANASYTNNTITGNGTPLGAGPNVVSPPTITGGAGNNCGGVACP